MEPKITYDDGEECWNCDGEGVIYNCHQPFACRYPEEGCALCGRRCDVCDGEGIV